MMPFHFMLEYCCFLKDQSCSTGLPSLSFLKKKLFSLSSQNERRLKQIQIVIFTTLLC